MRIKYWTLIAVVRIVILLGIFATIFTSCSKFVDGLPHPITRFFDQSVRSEAVRPVRVVNPAAPKIETKVQSAKPSTKTSVDPNEEFRKALTGGVEIIWPNDKSQKGIIRNRNTYDVRITMLSRDSREPLKWPEKKLFVPGEYYSFDETNIIFAIYSISGIPQEERKSPKN